jgi:uncharacterized membrane protein YphA (DoxX/SURF4 family)
MLIPSDDTPAKPAAEEGLGRYIKSAAILRIGAGLVLARFHGWPGATGAYQFLWKEKEWDWIPVFYKAHVPYPHLVAPAVAFVIAAIALSWILGFVTRLFSAAFIPVIIGAMIIAQRLHSPHMEICALYLAIAATLLLFGSGKVSVDLLFHLGQKKNEQPKRR